MAQSVVAAAEPLSLSLSPSLLRVPDLMLRLFLFEVVYDFLFYFSHRLCHMGFLYQLVGQPPSHETPPLSLSPRAALLPVPWIPDSSRALIGRRCTKLTIATSTA